MNDHKEKFAQYEALLKKWQPAINLVSPDTLSEIRTRHIEDSAQLVDLIPAGAKTLFDLGSGAGFPGLVIAMMRPDLEVHLVESDQKKCAFLSTVSRETKTPVIIHNSRVEERVRRGGSELKGEGEPRGGSEPGGRREQEKERAEDQELVVPDVITARALASLEKLLAYVLPWAQQNPALTLLFLKGEKAQEEITQARAAYDFEVVTHPSKTAVQGVVAEIKNLKEKN